MNDEFNSEEKKESFLDKIFLRIFNRRKRKVEYIELKRKPKRKAVVSVLNGTLIHDNTGIKEVQKPKSILEVSNILDAEENYVFAAPKGKDSEKKEEVVAPLEISNDESVGLDVETPQLIVPKKEENVPVDSVKNDSNLSSGKEVAELVLEEGIVEYFEELLKENRYKINKLVAEYNQQMDDYDKLVLQDDAMNHSDEIACLLDRIRRIKEELDLLRKSFNLDESYKFDDNYIAHLMDEYRGKFNNQFDERVLEDIKTDKEYLSLLAKIYFLDKFTSDLQDEVTYKISDFKDRDKNFEDFKVALDDNDKSFDEINYMIKNSEYMIKDLEDKVNNSKHIIERVEYVTRTVNNNLNALLFGYMAIRNNPLIPATVKALVATQMFIALFQRMMPITERHVHREVVIDDYEKEIIDGLKSIDDIFTLIDDTMAKVVDLRREFEEKFKEYDIPEFHEALDKLDQLSKNISERRDYLSYTKKEFDEQLDKNNAKVKKLDYDPYDEDNNRVDDIE